MNNFYYTGTYQFPENNDTIDYKIKLIIGNEFEDPNESENIDILVYIEKKEDLYVDKHFIDNYYINMIDEAIKLLRSKIKKKPDLKTNSSKFSILLPIIGNPKIYIKVIDGEPIFYNFISHILMLLNNELENNFSYNGD